LSFYFTLTLPTPECGGFLTFHQLTTWFFYIHFPTARGCIFKSITYYYNFKKKKYKTAPYIPIAKARGFTALLVKLKNLQCNLFLPVKEKPLPIKKNLFFIGCFCLSFFRGDCLIVTKKVAENFFFIGFILAIPLLKKRGGVCAT